jgi:hypothetical protein
MTKQHDLQNANRGAERLKAVEILIGRSALAEELPWFQLQIHPFGIAAPGRDIALTGSESVWFDRIKSTARIRASRLSPEEKVQRSPRAWLLRLRWRGMFYWDPADSTSVNNDGTVIQTEGVSMGRWKRI